MQDLARKRVRVTRGAGFLGTRLEALGCRDIVVPRRRDFDLVQEAAVERLYGTVRPEVVLHLSIAELAERIAALTGFEGRIAWDGSKPDGQPRRRLDSSRAARAFGFRARTSFADGLARTVAWRLAERAGGA